MDSLTQIVLGAAVGEAILGKKIGNKAILWGAIAGTIPDLDVFSKYFVDNLRANELHRGFSHSIIFSVLMAPILGWLVSKIYKNKEADWKEWSWMMFGSLITHPLLDAHTTWGTQLFWPLEYKVAYNNIFVVDPLYTIPFLVFLILAMTQRKGTRKRRKYNQLGLLISSTYMLLTIVFKGYGYMQFRDSLQKQNISYIDIETRPTPFNSLLWTANVETKEAFLIGYYSLLDSNNDIDFIRFEKNHELLKEMANEDIVKRLIKLSGKRYTIAEKEDKILFNDLRFGQLGVQSNNNEFVYSYELRYNDNNKLQAIERPKTFKEGEAMLGQFFRRIKGK